MPENITFPDPADYTEEPWTDPNGQAWIADEKGRWYFYVAPVTSGSSAWVDITASGTVTAARYIEGVTALGTVVSSSTITITGGSSVTATLTASTTCTFTMPTAAAGLSFMLHLKQAATTGNGSATFTGVVWPGGTAPTITATAGKMDILSFVAGPNAAGSGYQWFGSYIQNLQPS